MCYQNKSLAASAIVGTVLAVFTSGGLADPETSQPATTAPAAKVDLSKLDDAIEAFNESFKRNDAAAMGQFYFVKDAPDGRLALANARRILLSTAFQQAVDQRIKESAGKGLAGYRIDDYLDFPAPYYIHEHGDLAALVARSPNPKTEWFVKVGRVWKLDITPDPPFTIGDRAQDLEEDNAAVERITAAIDQGKLKTLRQVGDALGEAMLNGDPDSDGTGAMTFEDDQHPLPHDRPDPHGQFPSSPTTPAGAMNRFVRAVQNLDEATLRDALYLPEDKDGTARAAAAHDFVVGMRLLSAAESRFSNQEDSDRICSLLDAVTSNWFRGYTDNEWYSPKENPDMAMSSWASIPAKAPKGNFMDSVPRMRHCPDGVWRIGPRFPQNVRKLRAKAAALVKKDAILEKAIADIRSGKYATDTAAISATLPKLQSLGASPAMAGF